MELITLIRKPLQGTTIENIRAYGVGAMNIDDCRVHPTGESLDGGETKYKGRSKPAAEGWKRPWMDDPEALIKKAEASQAAMAKGETLGRYPANVIHDGSEEVIELFPKNAGAQAPVKRGHEGKSNGIYGDFQQKGDDGETFRGDSGSAARFFYCPKASASERNAGVPNKNSHTTVKPLALMQYLVRLVTPKGETCLDPYAGSGTTGCACLMEGFDSVMIDQEPEHTPIIELRMAHWQKKAGLGKQSVLGLGEINHRRA